MSLPGRAAVGSCPRPIAAAWLIPLRETVFLRELKAMSAMLIRKGNLTVFKFLKFIKICFPSPDYKLRQCFQDSLIWAVKRLIMSGNDE